jgi:hypothetical protein
MEPISCGQSVELLAGGSANRTEHNHGASRMRLGTTVPVLERPTAFLRGNCRRPSFILFLKNLTILVEEVLSLIFFSSLLTS